MPPGTHPSPTTHISLRVHTLARTNSLPRTPGIHTVQDSHIFWDPQLIWGCRELLQQEGACLAYWDLSWVRFTIGSEAAEVSFQIVPSALVQMQFH